MKRKGTLSRGKKAAIALSSIAAFLLAVIFALSALLFNFALNTQSRVHMSRLAGMHVGTQVARQEHGSEQVDYSGFVGTQEEQDWFAGMARDVFMTSDDGLKLHAYRLDNENADGKYVISCHGYTSESSHMAALAKDFYEHGYTVVTPDARAHGRSEGSFIGMGWLERGDILKWIDLIVQEDPEAKIVLHGISMGGAAVMMVSGEQLPSNVKAIIEDCGYSSVWDEFKWQAKSMFKLPAFPLLYTASAYSKLRAGYSFGEANAVEQVKKCKVPMLFIHGDADVFVPFSMLDEVYNAASCEKEKLVIEGAPHGMARATDKELYWSVVAQFLEKHV